MYYIIIGEAGSTKNDEILHVSINPPILNVEDHNPPIKKGNYQ